MDKVSEQRVLNLMAVEHIGEYTNISEMGSETCVGELNHECGERTRVDLLSHTQEQDAQEAEEYVIGLHAALAGTAERGAADAAYYQKNKARRKVYNRNPHRKAKQREHNRKYYQNNKARIAAKQKVYRATPRGKAKQKESEAKRRANPQRKAKRK